MEMTIKACDGKAFTGDTDSYGELLCKAVNYEADLKLKKEKEEAERKAREDLKQERLDKILKIYKAYVDEVAKYEKDTNERVYFEKGLDGSHKIASTGYLACGSELHKLIERLYKL
jgi:hypothetical protein